ncbi:hypothetical protein BDA99DRAFT_583608 [Phascolomyces articulosus]|uniref:Uncharacterized protein n=1 Tax=Phascolomyces articulosus TaxID=60185 RepID=A0AAD5K714_9FUNG|nr:hypothetical protein BDA99DRAFT_583608 [Phascolomyces articulosus]
MTDQSATTRLKVIRSFLSGIKQNKPVNLQTVINGMETEIIQSALAADVDFDYQGVWVKNFRTCASELGIQLDNMKVSWKSIEKKLNNEHQGNTSAPAESRSTPAPVASSTSSSSSSTCPGLKTKLSNIDREKVLKVYDALLQEESTCWVLKATKRQAIIEERTPWSVERKMREFVATLTFVHPSLSFILDTDDLNWVDYFNKEELNELKNSGQPLLRRVHHELKPKFDQIENLKSALDVYNYGRLIDHHPIEQPLLAWLSQTLMQTATFFIPGARTSTQNMLESDKLYYLWGLLNTIHRNSGIEALGKEKCSTSHSKTLNSKRKLSAVDEIEREKIGRRLDTVYIGGGIELGGLEAGPAKDNTKEFEDSMLKLPFVFKDMLNEIVSCRPSLIHKAHVLGYNINDADIPDGHIVRIRRTNELECPSDNDDYVLKILSLLELASYGKAIIDDTYSLCCQTRVPPSATGNPSPLPLSFSPSIDNQVQSSNASGSAKKSRKNTN